MFKDFKLDKYLNKKPPSDNSVTTRNEINKINKIPIRENFVKEKDDGAKNFEKIVGKDPVIKQIIDESGPIIDKLKKHYNRPRPKVLAKKMGIDMKDIELKSMKSPAYPSGHSVQGYLLAHTLGDKYPLKRDELMKMARDISYSRQVAHAHYPSDSLFGEQIGKDMAKHIKKGS
tara:strand:+ start:248 stop:769 length:522 start_codon:yes stop_codon:yes gene_type:complete